MSSHTVRALMRERETDREGFGDRVSGRRPVTAGISACAREADFLRVRNWQYVNSDPAETRARAHQRVCHRRKWSVFWIDRSLAATRLSCLQIVLCTHTHALLPVPRTRSNAFAHRRHAKKEPSSCPTLSSLTLTYLSLPYSNPHRSRESALIVRIKLTRDYPT